MFCWPHKHGSGGSLQMLLRTPVKLPGTACCKWYWQTWSRLPQKQKRPPPTGGSAHDTGQLSPLWLIPQCTHMTLVSCTCCWSWAQGAAATALTAAEVQKALDVLMVLFPCGSHLVMWQDSAPADTHIRVQQLRPWAKVAREIILLWWWWLSYGCAHKMTFLQDYFPFI